MNIYQEDIDCTMRTLTASKLENPSLQRLKPRADLLAISVEKLFKVMKMVFENRSSRLTLKHQFEIRKWKQSMRFEIYFYEIAVMGNKNFG